MNVLECMDHVIHSIEHKTNLVLIPEHWETPGVSEKRITPFKFPPTPLDLNTKGGSWSGVLTHQTMPFGMNTNDIQKHTPELFYHRSYAYWL